MSEAYGDKLIRLTEKVEPPQGHILLLHQEIEADNLISKHWQEMALGKLKNANDKIGEIIAGLREIAFIIDYEEE